MKKIAGMHLTIDGYVRDNTLLEPEPICSMFDALVDILGMKYLQRPIAMRVPLDVAQLETDEDEGGWSVVCQITTSHMALHGWPMRGAFMMDIFSCKPFDSIEAVRTVERNLDVTHSNVKLMERKDPVYG